MRLKSCISLQSRLRTSVGDSGQCCSSRVLMLPVSLTVVSFPYSATSRRGLEVWGPMIRALLEAVSAADIDLARDH